MLYVLWKAFLNMYRVLYISIIIYQQIMMAKPGHLTVSNSDRRSSILPFNRTLNARMFSKEE